MLHCPMGWIIHASFTSRIYQCSFQFCNAWAFSCAYVLNEKHGRGWPRIRNSTLLCSAVAIFIYVLNLPKVLTEKFRCIHKQCVAGPFPSTILFKEGPGDEARYRHAHSLCMAEKLKVDMITWLGEILRSYISLSCWYQQWNTPTALWTATVIIKFCYTLS